MLLWLLYSSSGLNRPGQVIRYVATQEFKAVDYFHTVSIIENGRVVRSALPGVQDHFFCFLCLYLWGCLQRKLASFMTLLWYVSPEMRSTTVVSSANFIMKLEVWEDVCMHVMCVMWVKQWALHITPWDATAEWEGGGEVEAHPDILRTVHKQIFQVDRWKERHSWHNFLLSISRMRIYSTRAVIMEKQPLWTFLPCEQICQGQR